MRNILLVAFREFWQRVRTRGFLLTSIAMPLILLVIWAGSSLVGADEGPGATPELTPESAAAGTVAYVDQAELIERVPPPLSDELLRSFPDVATAEAALVSGEVDAYYVIPADYRQTGRVQRVSRSLPTGAPDTGAFNWLILGNLVPGDPSTGADTVQLARLRSPFQSAQLPVVQVSPEGEEGTGSNSMMPFLVTILVLIPLFTSGSYLLYSLSQEKSNRIMEILLVSLRPRDLLVGKLLGLGALTLVQYLIWAVIGLAVFLLTGQDLGALSGAVNLSGSELLLVVLFALGGYGLYATIMAGLGALSPDMESSRSWVFFITLPMLIPIYLWVPIVNAPHGSLAVALSLVPFSAPVAMLMRLASTAVPDWQVALSLVLLALTAVGMVWLMSRLFRVQTLLSGESLSVGRFWAALTH